MGRRPLYSRAQRIERGLPVCRTDDCDRAPHRNGWCGTCYDGAPKDKRRLGVPTFTLHVDVREDLGRAVLAEAERRHTYPARLVEEALEPVVRSWGTKT